MICAELIGVRQSQPTEVGELTDIVEVKDSGIRGKGVFAARRIAAGDAILRIDDSVVVTKDDPTLGPLIGGEPDHCDYLPDGTVILMQEPERYINHSCEPNVYCYAAGTERFVLAMHGIPAGDELAFDYAIGEVDGDWLDCRCGARTCRGRHRSDFFALSEAKQLEYLPYLSFPFAEMHRQRIIELLEATTEHA
jgi:uncharacterized protein